MDINDELKLREVHYVDVPEGKEFGWDDDIDVYGDSIFVVKKLSERLWSIDVYSIPDHGHAGEYLFNNADTVAVLSDTRTVSVTKVGDSFILEFYSYSDQGYNSVGRYEVELMPTLDRHPNIYNSLWTSLEQKITRITKVFGESIVIESIDEDGNIEAKNIVYSKRKFPDIKISYLPLDSGLYTYMTEYGTTYMGDDAVEHEVDIVPRITVADTLYHIRDNVILVRKLSSLSAYKINGDEYDQIPFQHITGFLVPTNRLGYLANYHDGVLRILKA